MLDKRTKQIWRGLVDYANTDNLESRSDSLQNLASTLFECVPWMALTEFEDVPAMILLRTGRGKPVWKSQQQASSEFRDQAIEYQPQVRRLLTWLSDPTQHSDDRPAAWKFLTEHTVHVEFQRADPDSNYLPPEEETRYWNVSGQPKVDFPYRTLAYKDIADPICDFIQGEYRDGRRAPLRVCKRPGCGNPVFQFKKRQYCRTPACDHERQKRESDIEDRKNRDRVFISRLKRLTLAMRKKKAQKNLARLRDMASYWRDEAHKNLSIAKHALELLKLIGISSDDLTPTGSSGHK